MLIASFIEQRKRAKMRGSADKSDVETKRGRTFNQEGSYLSEKTRRYLGCSHNKSHLYLLLDYYARDKEVIQPLLITSFIKEYTKPSFMKGKKIMSPHKSTDYWTIISKMKFIDCVSVNYQHVSFMVLGFDPVF